jgi:predicted RNA-binding Zn-ribbon protein involved in translation (DUF1610 family)
MHELEHLESANLDFNAECPGCNASIEFNPEVGKLKCPYCDFETEIATPENEEDKTAKELDFASAQDVQNFDWGTEKKTVTCKACGAETIYDALQVADSCPYCGSNQVMEASAVNSLAPNGVCSFEITDTQAAEKFQVWLKRKWFVPKAAKLSARTDAFKGVYLPYWTFDTKTSSRYTAKYGKHRQVKDKNGNTKRETDWYPVSGFYQEFIDDHLVSATSRYNQNIMKKIEPFNVLNNKSYRPEYVAGFLAERYSVGLKDGWGQARKEIQRHLDGKIKAKIKRDHQADVVSDLKFSTTHDGVTYKYLLLPVWQSSYRYKNDIYHFMVNGQTGQVGGEAPISGWRITFAIILVMAVIAILYYIMN